MPLFNHRGLVADLLLARLGIGIPLVEFGFASGKTGLKIGELRGRNYDFRLRFAQVRRRYRSRAELFSSDRQMIAGLQHGDADPQAVATTFCVTGPQDPSRRLFHDQGVLLFGVVHRQGDFARIVGCPTSTADWLS